MGDVALRDVDDLHTEHQVSKAFLAAGDVDDDVDTYTMRISRKLHRRATDSDFAARTAPSQHQYRRQS